jgi:hypothetical protein
MRRIPFIIVATVAASLGSTVRADAQKVTIDVTGLPPGASVMVALAAANLNKTEPIPTSTAGSASGVLDFANLGKAEPIQRESVQVYILDCSDPARVVRVVFVAEGGNVPRECDEKQQGSDKRCRCRPVIVPIFLSSSTTRIAIDVATGTVQGFDGAVPGVATTAGRRNWHLLFGGGVEYVNNRSVESPQIPPNFTRTASDLEDAGWSGTFFTEFYPIPWLGAGYAYQSGNSVTLNETLTFVNPRLTLTGDFEFDPRMHDVYASARFPPRAPVQLFVQGGAAIWSARSTNIFRSRDGTTVTGESTIEEDHNGVAPYFAGGVDWFFNRHFGLRVRYAFERLKADGNGDDEEGPDEKYHKVAIIFVVNPWPLDRP